MNGINEKTNGNKFFTIEFFGVTLIVTTFMLLVALLFGENVLFELGAEIQYFLLGVFGYFAYPLLVCVNITGFMLLLGKKITAKESASKIKTLVYLGVVILVLLNVISGQKNPNSFSEYTSHAFYSARKGLSGVVGGGYIFAMLAYPIVQYLTYVGGIIATSLLLFISLAIIIRNYLIYKPQVVEKEVKTETATQPQQPPQPQVIVVQPQPIVQPQPVQQPYSQMREIYPSTPMSEKDYMLAEKERAMQILYGQKPQTYSDSYMSSFERDRLAVEPTPQKPQLLSSGEVSSPISKTPERPDFTYEDKTTSTSSTIPVSEMFLNTDSKTDDTFDDYDTYSSKEEVIDIDEVYDTPSISSSPTSEYFDKKEEIPPIKKAEIKKEVIKETVVEESTISTEQNEENIIENIPKNFKYNAPPLSLLESATIQNNDYQMEVFKAETKNKIITTLQNLGVDTTVARVFRGPAVTRFDLVVPPNLRMEEITKLEKNLNLRIEARSDIRMIAPVPKTSFVGIEVPNEIVDTVKILDIVTSDEFVNAPQSTLTFALGKDIIGKPVSLDIAEMPHLLVSGTTGSGKSVCLNTMIISLMYKYSPLELRFIIVDPKFVDLEPFHNIPHMLFDTIIEDVKTTSAMLTWAVEEMDKRYRILSNARAKNLKEYNRKAKEKGEKIMPRLVIIIDEFADIMKRDKKGVGDKICLLAQKARAAGIHLILAAQRPSADIVEGPIKSNLPSRIVFRAASSIDSRVSLGEMGAEKLLGKGDCLYKTNTMPTHERVMGAYVSDDEMYKVIDYVVDNNEAYFDKNSWSKIMATCTVPEEVQAPVSQGSGSEGSKGVDSLCIKALKLGIEFGGLSTTFLQRKLALGFPRAAKIFDWLLDNGYISSDKVSGKNKVLITKEQFEEQFGSDDNDDT